MEYDELETLVNQKLGIKHYSFTEIQECNIAKDASYRFIVDGKVNQFEDKRIKELKDGKFGNPSNRAILNKLCKEGHIDAGEYLIMVSW